MSLSQNSYGFLSKDHSMIRAAAAFDLPIAVGAFFDVEGESHIIGSRQGRNLFCEITLDDYSTTTALETAVDELQSKVGTLTGTITETISGNTRTFPACTFLGFVEQGEAFFDGASQKWVQFGRLLWRQRGPS